MKLKGITPIKKTTWVQRKFKLLFANLALYSSQSIVKSFLTKSEPTELTNTQGYNHKAQLQAVSIEEKIKIMSDLMDLSETNALNLSELSDQDMETFIKKLDNFKLQVLSVAYRKQKKTSEEYQSMLYQA